MLLQAILAAVLGTVAMTLSSTTEMQWRERQPSTVPARAVLTVLRPIWSPELKDRGVQILATWTHWLYGAGWGVAWWLLVGVASLGAATASVAFFLVVWGAEQAHLPLLRLTPPSWRWGWKENLIDAWHHVVFAAGTAVGWLLLSSL